MIRRNAFVEAELFDESIRIVDTEWNYLTVIHSIPANYESFEEPKRDRSG
jgi:hypothetical protein